MQSQQVSTSAIDSTNGSAKFFGHPRGLATLFFTEFWERFSYYGMRAILLLFMTASAITGGLEMDATTAGFIYGTYTSMAYLAGIAGGWIADKVLGQKNAVFYGGILISLGNAFLAFTGLPFFFAGLATIVLGTGLLKPNISAMVGALYSQNESAKRDAGFSIFYMGINLGAMVAPIVVGFLGEKINWHYGFAAASIGMAFGLVVYKFSGKHIKSVGNLNLEDETIAKSLSSNRKNLLIALLAFAIVVGGLVFAQVSGAIKITSDMVRSGFNVVYIVLPMVFFGSVFTASDLNLTEKLRFVVIGIFFLMSAVFWGGFEQAGTTLTIFARDLTDRVVGGAEVPTSFFQSLNATFIIVFASLFAWLWVKLGDKQPSSPAKLSLGLIIAGSGFLLLAIPAMSATPDHRVSPLWLIAVYLIHTIGELCLSPVGLSNVTKLAPQRYVSQAMGIWFLGASIGNYLAGQATGFVEVLPASQVFTIVAGIMAGSGVLVLLFLKPIKKMMGGVQ